MPDAGIGAADRWSGISERLIAELLGLLRMNGMETVDASEPLEPRRRIWLDPALGGNRWETGESTSSAGREARGSGMTISTSLSAFGIFIPPLGVTGAVTLPLSEPTKLFTLDFGRPWLDRLL